MRIPVRLAWRDAVRHKGRALLIVALIALPVTGLVGLDVLVRSSQATPAEQVARELAGSDAWVQADRGVISLTQSPDGFVMDEDRGDPSADPSADPNAVGVAEARPAAEVLAQLPAGSTITPWRSTTAPVLGRDGRYRSEGVDLLDITAPAAGGRYRVVAGAAPRTADQIAMTPELATTLGLRLGDRVSVGAPARELTLAALVQRAVPSRDAPEMVAMPGAVSTARSWDPLRYLVRSPEPITWAMVQDLNGHGVLVYSRAAMLDPAAASAKGTTADSLSVVLAAGVVVAVVLGALQVVFLAGPAFAVGARRIRRQLGQLVSAGATPRQVTGVVLASGLVLGTVGATLGVALGLALATAGRPLAEGVFNMPWSALHLHWAEIAAIAAIGVLTALLAALVPAISAGRSHPLAMLGRAPAGPRSARWWSLAGLVACGAGVIVTVIAATRPVPQGDPGPLTGRGIGIAAGVLAAELGLIMATPLLLQLAARLGVGLPAAPRLALRDAARHRGRTAPAVAAIMAATSVAVAASIFLSTISLDATKDYVPALGDGQVAVTVDTRGLPTDQATAQASEAAAERVVAHQLPGARSAAYYQLVGSSTNPRDIPIPAANLCPWTQPRPGVPTQGGRDSLPPPSQAELPAASTDWRCTGQEFSTITDRQASTHALPPTSGNALPIVLIAGPEFRRMATGVADPEADAALRAGGAVVMDRRYLAADHTVRSGAARVDEDTGMLSYDQERSVQAVLGRWSPTYLGVILSPQAAVSLGFDVGGLGLLVDPPRGADAATLDALVPALDAQTAGNSVYYVEQGPAVDSRVSLVWLILAVACLLIAGTVTVVTALGITDAAPDLATLGAVGARPRIRRALSGYSAATVTALGCVLGGALGLVPAFGLLALANRIGGSDAHQLAITAPWGAIGAMCVGLPVLAFGLAFLATRSRIPLVARAE